MEGLGRDAHARHPFFHDPVRSSKQVGILDAARRYPLYHAAKRWTCCTSKSSSANGAVENPGRAAVCGSLSSATAAIITTPFDVAQTRVMLADNDHRSMFAVIGDLVRTRGVSALFAGAAPRAAWMSLGGLVFLGSYEYAKCMYHNTLHSCEKEYHPC